MTTIWGIGTAIWYIRHHEPLTEVNLDLSNGAAFYLDPVADTLKNQGLVATEDYLKKRFRRIVYVVDVNNSKELLGRKIPKDFLEFVNQKSQTTLQNNAIQTLSVDGHHYLLFVADIPSPWRNRPLIPVVPLVGATLASLLFAFILARHLSRPIEILKQTISQVGAGHFNITLHPQLVDRNDSLGELACDIKNMSLRLGKLIDSQTKLLHTISHELRSPLTRLQMATGLLRQKHPTNDDEMSRIERECKRIDLLIGELLTLSKLDDGINHLNEEIIDLNSLIQEITDNALFEAKSLNKSVSLNVINELIQVKGDASLLYYAVENVVRNALRHAKTNIVITVIKTLNDKAHISVVDDGEGVDDSEITQITQPFFRASNSQRVLNNKGFGLGLAITYKTLKAHHGEIQFANLSDKKGFKVDFYLPILS
ncbi:ATP-binding protein [Ferrovum sp. PN-J185]|uniref:ATP-binding protein n=1 Tax=Ferrovum sp. PN-J185 TaxID=1356306 RepID=UPI001E4E140C|nr:ATP-binding protein [Ferrovum sp. PN-J185]MCC6068008.1 ATP-binding protein [Ferrovum sp. PN-J185]